MFITIDMAAVANGSLVDLEQRAGRGRILTQTEIGPQRRTQPGGLGVRGSQRSKLACDELTREALILDDERLEPDVVVPCDVRSSDRSDPILPTGEFPGESTDASSPHR
jgi:hypothetical protein